MPTPTTHEGALRERFKDPATGTGGKASEISEKGCEYTYRAIDRQINKARGVLAYNGLLFASFSLVARNLPSDKNTDILMLASVGAIFALLSCLFLLSLMILDIGEPADYASPESDFKKVIAAVLRRAKWMKASLVLSLLATIAAIFLPAIALYRL